MRILTKPLVFLSAMSSGITTEWALNPGFVRSALSRAVNEGSRSLREALIPVIANIVVDYLQVPPARLFDDTDWNIFIGRVNRAPLPPLEFEAFLQKSCPFFARQESEDKEQEFNNKVKGTIKDTWLIRYMPPTVNDIPLTILTMEKHAQKPLHGNSTKFRVISNEVRMHLGNLAVERGYWVAMAPDVIGRGNSYSKQLAEIAKKAKECDAPSMREAVICAFTEYVKTRTRILSDEPWTYTRCYEQIEYLGKISQTAFGGFAQSGPNVDAFSYYDHLYDGVAPVLRKFSFIAHL